MSHQKFLCRTGPGPRPISALPTQLQPQESRQKLDVALEPPEVSNGCTTQKLGMSRSIVLGSVRGARAPLLSETRTQESCREVLHSSRVSSSREYDQTFPRSVDSRRSRRHASR